FETNSVPIVPSIKNWLRYRNGSVLWKTNDRNQNKKIENWLFGTIKNGKESSKINISSAYKVDAYKVNNNLWEFRIWGWIPKSYNPEGFNRENFLNNLKNALNGSGKFKMPWNELLDNKTNQTQNHKLIVWREFESPRDTIKPNETSIENFIQSLLKNDGGYQ
ncbi:MAG: hypothetical protein H5T85_05120, partial [Actinobacteria bacterium]|nr:hypothetical protein [Actinomycetota bacterium]